jgi:hypothetical protein
MALVMKINLGRNKNGQLIISKSQIPYRAKENSPSKSGKISDKRRLLANEEIQPAWFKNLHDITFLYTGRAKSVIDVNPLMYDYHARKLHKIKKSLGR